MLQSIGKTCVACAKIKVKCDKKLPRCGRCERLDIDCLAQAQRPKGRRPMNKVSKSLPSSLPSPSETTSATTSADMTTPTMLKTSSKITANDIDAIEPALQVDADGDNIEQAQLLRPIDGQEENQIKSVNRYKYNAFFDAFIATLSEAALKGSLQELMLAKYVAVTKWLGHMACSMKSKEMHHDISVVLKMLNGESLEPFEPRSLIEQTDPSRCQNWTPAYVASMNCDGSAFIVHHLVNGSSLFLTNEDMTERFVSTKEANLLYASTGGDPTHASHPFGRILSGASDGEVFSHAVFGLIFSNPNLNCETSLFVNCRKGNSEFESSPNLCQLRLSLAADGRHLCTGIKFTPLPSPYPVNPYAPSYMMNGNSYPNSSSWGHPLTSFHLSAASSSSSSSNSSPRFAQLEVGYNSSNTQKENTSLQRSPVVLAEPQPPTRELSYHQSNQQAESWSNVHPPDVFASGGGSGGGGGGGGSELDLWDPSAFEYIQLLEDCATGDATSNEEKTLPTITTATPPTITTATPPTVTTAATPPTVTPTFAASQHRTTDPFTHVNDRNGTQVLSDYVFTSTTTTTSVKRKASFQEAETDISTQRQVFNTALNHFNRNRSYKHDSTKY